MVSKEENPETSKTKDGFITVAGRRRQGARKTVATATREPPSSNPFDALHRVPENMDTPQIPPMTEVQQGQTKGKTVETPIVEKTSSIPASNAMDVKPLDPEDGDAENGPR
jgi:hypothetical protein